MAVAFFWPLYCYGGCYYMSSLEKQIHQIVMYVIVSGLIDSLSNLTQLWQSPFGITCMKLPIGMKKCKLGKKGNSRQLPRNISVTNCLIQHLVTFVTTVLVQKMEYSYMNGPLSDIIPWLLPSSHLYIAMSGSYYVSTLVKNDICMQ